MVLMLVMGLLNLVLTPIESSQIDDKTTKCMFLRLFTRRYKSVCFIYSSLKVMCRLGNLKAPLLCCYRSHHKRRLCHRVLNVLQTKTVRYL